MSGRVLPVISIASAVVALTLFGVRVSKHQAMPAPAVSEHAPEDRFAAPAVSAPSESASPPHAVTEPEPVETAANEPAPGNAAEAPLSAVKEIVPSASPRALQTIQGTIKVSVRVNIDDNGAVSEATLVNAGPSKYFARLAIEAAKQWTFTPSPSDTSRTTLLRFDFTRAGVTAHMIA